MGARLSITPGTSRLTGNPELEYRVECGVHNWHALHICPTWCRKQMYSHTTTIIRDLVARLSGLSENCPCTEACFAEILGRYGGDNL